MDEPIEKRIEAALALQQNNQIPEAIALFKAVLLEAPQQPDALQGMGMSLVQQKLFSAALPFLQKAIAIAPNIAPFHNNIANTYKALGKIDEALRHYHEALRLKTPYPEALNNLAALLYRIGKYAQALEYFQKSLRSQPQSADTHYNIANCYVQLDRLLEAKSHYETVLALHPNHWGAMHNLGIILCTLKDFEQAKPLLEHSLLREPDNIDTLFHLGVIYSALFQIHDAKRCYEKILTIDNQHAASHHNLATLLLQSSQPAAALLHFEHALLLQPENKTAAHMIGALKKQTLPQGAPLEYTRALFDQYAYNYDAHVKNRLHYRVPYLLRKAITPFVTQTAPWRAADLGCGTGAVAPLFSDIVGKLIGVDLSPNMISVAKQHGGYYQLYVDNLYDFLLRYRENFDLIIAADVFVYCGDLTDIFSAAFRALVNTGFFCFSVEALSTLEIEAQPDFSDYQVRNSGRYAHNPAYIRRLSHAIGFSILLEKTEILRSQEEVPVNGYIYILQKK